MQMNPQFLSVLCARKKYLTREPSMWFKCGRHKGNSLHFEKLAGCLRLRRPLNAAHPRQIFLHGADPSTRIVPQLDTIHVKSAVPYLQADAF